jgi:hypothetical protein
VALFSSNPRWLENGADPKVHDWSLVQDNRTRTYLNALALRRPIYDRLFELNAQTSPSYYCLPPTGDHIFATYLSPVDVHLDRRAVRISRPITPEHCESVHNFSPDHYAKADT